MSAKEPGSLQIVGTLALAGLLSGLILVVVYLWTRPMILTHQAEALEAAVFRVVPGAVKTAPYELVADQLRPYTGPKGTFSANPMAYAALAADGSVSGYAVPAQGAGFQDTIKLIYGFDPKTARIVGMEILESKETPGLGDKIFLDEHFKSNFKSLSVTPGIVAVKPGAKSKPNEVDTITGATISSKAVVKILHQSTQQWVPRLPAAK